MSNARLLDRVCYLSKAPSTATDIFGNGITVKHTFPYNPASKTAPDTAKRWADGRTYDRKLNQWVDGPEPEFLERSNDPFNVVITDIDVRSEGGRAYKVVDEQGRCFDLREDQVLEVFKYTGIEPGGKIPGQFVWGILGSQVRMVLVGGDLHKEMVKNAQAQKDLAKKQDAGLTPSEATLKFGRIYKKRDGSLHLFLGKVKVPGMKKVAYAFVELPERPSRWDDVNLEDITMTTYGPRYKEYIAQKEVSFKWNEMSWFERTQWDWYGSRVFRHQQYPQVEQWYYDGPANIVLMSSPKFDEEVGVELDLAKQLRDNEGSKHRYVNGYGDDLAEKLWERESNGGNRRAWNGNDFSYWNMSYETRLLREKEIRIAVQKQYIATRTEFQKQLEWV